MDIKALKEWMGTAEGFGTAAISLLGVAGALSDRASNLLGGVYRYFGIAAERASPVVSTIIVVLFGLIIWRGYRRFMLASRLERPDAFTLHPTTPSTLIGRDEDLSRLVNAVKQHRLVLLDGESGCGKSALISAGLLPVLQSAPGLLPVVIREWGDDWVRGPLAAALDAIFNAATPAERERLGWTSAPDLAADVCQLAADVERRLTSLFGILGRRTLLIADQFDDYQARHRHCFLDADGNWLTPAEIVAANLFWKAVSTGLQAGHLHLLVVARSDTAAGLSCVRFLGDLESKSRPLPRVESDYLHSLLLGIAPEDALPRVVSHPEGGWNELRERVERDLRGEGAILMQQVRMVLLGLRQLPLLTPKHYVAAGGMRGIESLVITRGLSRAAHAVGGGVHGRRVACAVLAELVQPAAPDQPPKARRAPLSQLHAVTGDPAVTRIILDVLQHEELVRPAESVDGAATWQLDHDYLAGAALAGARQESRWSIALREGMTRYENATGSWRRRYAALLPMSMLVRLLWERLRNRLKFGGSTSYVLVSSIKPASVIFTVVFAGFGVHAWNQDRQLDVDAYRLIGGFAYDGGGKAVVEIWRAPARLRQRVLEHLRTQSSGLELALAANWHWAHAGMDPINAQEVAALLSDRLIQGTTEDWLDSTSRVYIDVLLHRDGSTPTTAEAISKAIGVRLAGERDGPTARFLADAYAASTAKLGEGWNTTAAAILRKAFLEQKDYTQRIAITESYAAVVARINDQRAIKTEAVALRQSLAEPPGDAVRRTYTAVVARLNDADLSAEAKALLALIISERRERAQVEYTSAFQSVAARLHDPVEIGEFAAALRARVSQEPEKEIAKSLVLAYGSVAAQLGDQGQLAEAATFLRGTMKAEVNRLRDFFLWQASSGIKPEVKVTDLLYFTRAYIMVARRLVNPANVRTETTTLRTWMAEESMDDVTPVIAKAYAALAKQIVDKTDAKPELEYLRSLVGPRFSTYTDERWHAYIAFAGRLDSAADLNFELPAWRKRLKEILGDPDDQIEARIYNTLAAQLPTSRDRRNEAATLRDLMTHQSVFYGPAVGDAYVRLTGSLDPEDLRTEANALYPLLLREQDHKAPPHFLHAYASVAKRLNDREHLSSSATALGARLQRVGFDRHLATVADDYADVVLQLSDAPGIDTAASILGRRVKSSNTYCDPCSAYARVAARQRNYADVQAAVKLLRAKLSELEASADNPLTEHYSLVAAKLSRAEDVKAELADLRARMKATSSDQFGRAYASLPLKLLTIKELESEAASLRGELVKAYDAYAVATLSKAYSAILGSMIARPDTDRRAIVREILTFASHPLLQSSNEYLGAMAPVAGTDFGNSLLEAVHWAQRTQGIRSEQLRPQPLRE